MKYSLCLLLLCCTCFVVSAQILIETPERPIGQSDVLELKCEPLDTVRVGFIGLGARGSSLLKNLLHVPGVKIVALCDIEESKVQKANEALIQKNVPKAKEFFGNDQIWKDLVAENDVDLIYIATDWSNHAKMGIEAMRKGKHVAIEVPAAMTMDEIWGLINTSEQTRRHCIQLENCIYDFFEMTTMNMAQQGLFGEIVHAEGAYIHALDKYWDKYWNNWRLNYNKNHRGDVYPTHGIGPISLILNIHRGDRYDYLVSVDTKPFGFSKKFNDSTFRNGDHTSTLIKTIKGKTISLQHNVISERPYDRKFEITGTNGYAVKYPSPNYALNNEEKGFSAHNFLKKSDFESISKKYQNPITKEIEGKAKEVGGHGGMDYIMNYRLIYCLRNGLPMDMDVYDLAEWCCIVPLSETSLDNNSIPVKIPDFTRGCWNRLSSHKMHTKGPILASESGTGMDISSSHIISLILISIFIFLIIKSKKNIYQIYSCLIIILLATFISYIFGAINIMNIILISLLVSINISYDFKYKKFILPSLIISFFVLIILSGKLPKFINYLEGFLSLLNLSNI